MTRDTLVRVDRRGRIGVLTLDRPAKRNSLSAQLFADLASAIDTLDSDVAAVVLAGEGEHFCSGLDLSEHVDAVPFQSALQSRECHALFNRLHRGGVPVVSALQGAVIGGGLELAASTHVRVADSTTFYQLPEGRHGIYLGGGGSVRITRIIGSDRMTEMMLTGRRLGADEGQTLGLSHYLVGPGESLDKALELAEQVAANAPMSNYLMLAVPQMTQDMSSDAGLFTESVAQALTLTSDDARRGMEAFLNRKSASPQTTPDAKQPNGVPLHSSFLKEDK